MARGVAENVPTGKAIVYTIEHPVSMIHFLFSHLYNSVFVHPCSPPFTLHRPRSNLFALFTLPQSRSPLLNVVYPCLPLFTLVQIRSPSFNPVHPLSPSFTFVHRLSTSFTPHYFCSLMFNSTLPCFFYFIYFWLFYFIHRELQYKLLY